MAADVHHVRLPGAAGVRRHPLPQEHEGHAQDHRPLRRPRHHQDTPRRRQLGQPAGEVRHMHSMLYGTTYVQERAKEWAPGCVKT